MSQPTELLTHDEQRERSLCLFLTHHWIPAIYQKQQNKSSLNKATILMTARV